MRSAPVRELGDCAAADDLGCGGQEVASRVDPVGVFEEKEAAWKFPLAVTVCLRRVRESTSACGRSLVSSEMRGKSGHRRAGFPVKTGARQGNRS